MKQCSKSGQVFEGNDVWWQQYFFEIGMKVILWEWKSHSRIFEVKFEICWGEWEGQLTRTRKSINVQGCGSSWSWGSWLCSGLSSHLSNFFSQQFTEIRESQLSLCIRVGVLQGKYKTHTGCKGNKDVGVKKSC